MRAGPCGAQPFGYAAFYPGPGVGGHCIPIATNYLSYAVRSLGHQFRFVELAQDISSRMPAYVASRAQNLLNTQRKARGEAPLNGGEFLKLAREKAALRKMYRDMLKRPVNVGFSGGEVVGELVGARPKPAFTELAERLVLSG